MNIILSFDDGRSDAFEAYCILKKYKLVGSFHITTGFIDGSFKSDIFGINRKPLSKPQLLEMHNNHMDISSHGDKHILDSQDYVTSIKKLSQWGIEKDSYGYSVPNSLSNNDELNRMLEENRSTLKYVRTGRNPSCYSLFYKTYYSLYHIFHLDYFFNQFNKLNLLTEINIFKLFSLVVKKDTKIKHLINFIEKHKNSNKTLIIMFHSIIDKPSNKWEWSKNDFGKLCSYLHNQASINTITLDSLANINKYNQTNC